MSEQIAVVGLGYVGLPVALAFARKFPGTIGFDINIQRVEALAAGHDHTGEVSAEALMSAGLRLTSDPEMLREADFFVVAVPTPVSATKQPDLGPLRRATETIGRVMRPGALIVFESTVYPGVTEDVCGPILAATSGLRQGVDFKLGYSPERINPGDTKHTLERVVKVVAGGDDEALARAASKYQAIIEAGIHRAPSIKVAEAAKVIENTQRDLNIALMNELALIFDRLGIRTADVLAAARTKWNFLPFTPGLVGGHCIGVDPYYLTTKAEEVGYHPQVILAGRRINDGMGAHVAQKLIKLLTNSHDSRPLKDMQVAILGLTFKENVSDIRNSRVPDIVSELRQFGIEPLVHDPHVDAQEAMAEYGMKLVSWEQLEGLEAVVLAVPHQEFVDMQSERLLSILKPNGVLIDIKSVLAPETLPSQMRYWSL